MHNPIWDVGYIYLGQVRCLSPVVMLQEPLAICLLLKGSQADEKLQKFPDRNHTADWEKF